MSFSGKKLVAAAATTLSVCALGLAGGAARADIIPAQGSPTVTASGTGTFLYTYNVLVTSTQTVNPGNFFTIYDFAGFLGVRSAPATFAATVTATSPPVQTSTGVVTPNDNADPNIRFTYTGLTPIVGGPTSLGAFVLESSFNVGTTPRAFVGQGTDTDTGQMNGNITNVVGPTASAIPEPGEWAFMGTTGVSLMGLMIRARRRIAA